MTLRVPFSNFCETAARHGIKEVYVCEQAGSVELTAVIEKTSRILTSKTSMGLAEVKDVLQHAHFEVFDGIWSLDAVNDIDEEPRRPAPFIAAVSYVSEESIPGVWIDAYPSQPTPVQVLRALYDEFRQTGELAEVAFEEFVRLASPNVAIASPTEIDSYLATKEDCPPSSATERYEEESFSLPNQ